MPKPLIEKYGAKWNPRYHPVQIELYAIQANGHWLNKAGETCGNGLFFHYKALREYLWPDAEWHRWSELQLNAYLKHRIIGVMGPAASGKTCEAAMFALSTYYAFFYLACFWITLRRCF